MTRARQRGDGAQQQQNAASPAHIWPVEAAARPARFASRPPAAARGVVRPGGGQHGGALQRSSQGVGCVWSRVGTPVWGDAHHTTLPRFGVPRFVRLGPAARSAGAVLLAPTADPTTRCRPRPPRPRRHGVPPQCIRRPRAGRRGRQGANPRALARSRCVRPASGDAPVGRVRGAPTPRARPARQCSAQQRGGHALRHRTCLAHSGSDAKAPHRSHQHSEHQRHAIVLELRRGHGAASAFSVCASTSPTSMRCILCCPPCCAGSVLLTAAGFWRASPRVAVQHGCAENLRRRLRPLRVPRADCGSFRAGMDLRLRHQELEQRRLQRAGQPEAAGHLRRRRR